ncbi:MAG: phosphoribosylformylglycinamidine synthase subunit PurL [Chloroflexota bacterium]
MKRLTEKLIIDPVTESYAIEQVKHRVVKNNNPSNNENSVEVAFRPGVTDNTAQELLEAARRMGISNILGAATGMRYQFDPVMNPLEIEQIASKLLVNSTIQRFSYQKIYPEFINTTSNELPVIETISLLTANETRLLKISEERRLALDLTEMIAIRDYFIGIERDPTDAELETLAQTWSEHCVHKTFKAEIKLDSGVIIDGILNRYLRSVTEEIDASWVRSAFVDNAGVIAFDDQFDLSFKVETHNHPSAIEPFGGANTGVGGVVRDVLGVSHRPIANTDVLCFGPQESGEGDLPENVLHPKRIQAGVVSGVGDYGNKLGIPTINGAIYYHPGYTANPLVYCGSIGIGPVDSHPTSPQPGDRIIVIGGRTGRDGIRGATFSSLTMDAQTGEVAGASVQIGDPITEKGLIEVVELARDDKLYNAITDCGAGGLSSAVGEMSSKLGANVDLENVTLKYQNLAPWEIWLSEAQERMVLAVPADKVHELEEICSRYWIELSDIGSFEESGSLKVAIAGTPVVELRNGFLHNGIPDKKLEASAIFRDENYLPASLNISPQQVNYSELLIKLLSHPNIASKEKVIRQYDHEVRGSTVVKPFSGEKQDGPSDAAVIKPLNTAGWRGFAVANGINPLIGESDPYYMALSVVDEAVRNLVAVGADPDRIALLDNFCWGNPNRPEILGSLVEAARGCRDAALLYRTPFISGKDSLNNEYIGQDGKHHAIPGTLLISSISIVPDIRKTITMDVKQAGHLIYLIGDWRPTFVGSHLARIDIAVEGKFTQKYRPPDLSEENIQVYRCLYKTIAKGLVTAAHDLSEGGLAVSLAEMCLAGRRGARVNLNNVDLSSIQTCFAETNGCLLVTVSSENKNVFEELFTPLPCRLIGLVSDDKILEIVNDSDSLIQLEIDQLLQAFTGSGKDPSHGS